MNVNFFSSGTFKTVQPVIVLPIPSKGRAKLPFGMVLPVGSQVYLHAVNSILHTDLANASPLGCAERIVTFRDVGGVLHQGWIAYNTPLSVGSGEPAFGDGDRDPISAWDDLRDQLFHRGWTVEHFCSRLKTSEVSLVRAVIRELGGATPKGDKAALAKILTRITHVQEVQMSQDTAEAGTATAKSAKKSKKVKKVAKGQKAKAKSNGEGGRSAVRSAGQAILDTGTGNGKIKAVAQRLLKGEDMKSKELIALRDQINEVAIKAREAGKDNLAAKLANANRLVRRLARAAS